MPDILKLSFEFSPKIGVRELPQLDEEHQSNVPGLYVVGDLADAPIIKVALRQGYEAALAALQPRFDLYATAGRINQRPWIAHLVLWRARRSCRLMQRLPGLREKSSHPDHLFRFRAWSG